MQSGFLVNGLPFQLAAGVIPAVAKSRYFISYPGEVSTIFAPCQLLGRLRPVTCISEGKYRVLFSLPDECVLVQRKGGEMHQPDLIAAHLKDHMVPFSLIAIRFMANLHQPLTEPLIRPARKYF